MKKCFHAGWLIDGSGDLLQKDQYITVEDGVISSISKEKPEGDGCEIVDYSLCTIVPPLFDCHVHLALSSTTDLAVRGEMLHAGRAEVQKIIGQNLHYHFIHGVLAVRDAGDKKAVVSSWCRDNQVDNGEGKVLVRSAGKAVCKEGKYGSYLGTSLTMNTFDEIAGKVDQVKIINSSINSLSKVEKEGESFFSLTELQQMVGQAHTLGKKVMVHCNGREAIKNAVLAGCDSVEHGYFMTEDSLELMVQKNIFWVPTLHAMEVCAEGVREGELDGVVGVAERTLDHQLHLLSLAREIGVKVAIGTDSGCYGVRHGESLSREIRLLTRAGYSLEEAVCCATSHGAELVGVEEIGLLKKGSSASFLVVRATPSMVLRKMTYLESIYKNGSKVYTKHREYHKSIR